MYSPATGVTQFLYDGDELVAEYNASGTMLRRYVHGDSDDDPLFWYEGAGLDQPRFPHTNRQGSITATSGPGATPLWINTYDEYGIPGADNQGQFQYTGQAWIPELGMYYYKARIYSPMLGRFMQVDPIGYKDQFNLYAYVRNNPVNRTDPTGLAGIGHNSASFGETLLDAGERAAKFTVTRVLGGLAMLASSTGAGADDNPAADKIIRFHEQRINNRLDVVNARHIEAALKEAKGQVVARRPDGRPFDHINELREARNGLLNDIKALKGQYGRGLGEDQVIRVRDAIGRASNMLDKVNRTLKKVNRMCTGTRICP